MTRAYAEGTDVPIERSKAELERVLLNYGADNFGYLTGQRAATVIFEVHGRRVKFVLPLPLKDDPIFAKFPSGKTREPDQRVNAREKEIMRRWRALLLVVKAKLEAISMGLAQFDDEFLAYICLPNGETVGEWMHPQIEHVLSGATMPPLLPGVTEQ